MEVENEEEILRILLIGGGGREHALAWKLSQSKRVGKIFCAPGNGGTAGISAAQNVPHLQPDNFRRLLDFASETKVNLVIAGPEAPYVFS